jgi:hypothetical protein
MLGSMLDFLGFFLLSLLFSWNILDFLEFCSRFFYGFKKIYIFGLLALD